MALTFVRNVNSIEVKEGCSVNINALSVQLRVHKKTLGILERISISAEAGQIIGILGPSGSGKTTLLRVIAGLIKPSQGDILIDGLDPILARKRQWLGWIPQKPTLFANRTVIGNIRFPLDITGRKPSMPLNEILEIVNLSDFQDAYPVELSGGMQQRVSLARALVTKPKLLLMDEPFSALDELLRERLQEEFLRIQQQMKQTVFFVTHSIEEAVFLADKIVIFTHLPARVKCLIDVFFDKERNNSLRFSQKYFETVKQVRKSIKQ